MRNTGRHQMERINKIGKEWSTNMNTSRYLTHSDVLLSLSTQLHPKLKWSIPSLSRDPKKIDDAVHSFYHQTMSRMGVNRKMKREMRTMTKSMEDLDNLISTLTILDTDSTLLLATGISPLQQVKLSDMPTKHSVSVLD